MEIFNKLLLIFCLFMIFLYCHELIEYFYESEQYRFGTEIAGWRYYSKYHYIGSLIFELLLFSIGAFAGMVIKNRYKITLLRFILLLLVIFMYLISCWIPDDYIGSKIESLLRAREVMELLVSTSAPEEAQ